MRYIIYAEDAQRLKDEIIYRVSNSEDKKGCSIDTWSIYNINNDIVIEHTTGQWENKGCLLLKVNDDNNKILVTFKYYNSCSDEDVSENDEGYILGRFSELLLVHFQGEYHHVCFN